MLEIYKTNVKTKSQSEKVMRRLRSYFSDAAINFDLHDCDKILRVDRIDSSDAPKIILHVKQLGHHCEILPG